MELLPILAFISVLSKFTWAHGGHHGEGGDKKPLEFSSEIRNKDHILDHLSHMIATKPKDQWSDEELEFHYFKLHDNDHNNKLDGTEIGKALTHFHEDNGQEGAAKEPPKVFSDEEISNIVDSVILENDSNHDGYIEYFEFKTKQAEAKQSSQQQQQNGQQPAH